MFTEVRQNRAVFSTLVLAVIVLCSSVSVRAQLNTGLPEDVKGLDVEQKIGAQIDLDLTFINEDGQTVALRDYFKHGRPVVLNLAYYSCPMLCGMVIKGVTNSLREVPWLPGREFEVVTISFDPREGAPLAKAKKEAVLVDYGRPQAREGWHFLVNQDDHAKKLADQIGFKYRWIEREQQFAHGSVTFILTPEGKMSRYLFGLAYEPRDMRLALTEASNGKLGTVVDKFMNYCYHYDPVERTYVLKAIQVMKLGGVVIVVAMVAMLFFFWRREFKGQQTTDRIQSGSGEGIIPH
ncbi:MAG: SCO family protein [Blastocatellia bacterium]